MESSNERFFMARFFIGDVYAEGPTDMFWGDGAIESCGSSALFNSYSSAAKQCEETFELLGDEYRFEIQELTKAEAEATFEIVL